MIRVWQQVAQPAANWPIRVPPIGMKSVPGPDEALSGPLSLNPGQDLPETPLFLNRGSLTAGRQKLPHLRQNLPGRQNLLR
jgi:hypothetical protein